MSMEFIRLFGKRVWGEREQGRAPRVSLAPQNSLCLPFQTPFTQAAQQPRSHVFSPTPLPPSPPPPSLSRSVGTGRGEPWERGWFRGETRGVAKCWLFSQSTLNAVPAISTPGMDSST